jgi:hypothetical protein
MSEASMAPDAGPTSGTPVSGILVLIGGLLAGVGVFLTWLKVTGATATVDFAGGTVNGTSVPPLHFSRAINLPSGIQATTTGWDHKSGKALLALAVIIVVIGAVMLVQRISGKGLAVAALVLALAAIAVCVYVFVQRDSQAQQSFKEEFQRATGQDLSQAINAAVSQQGISGLTASLSLSASVQLGLILSAIGAVVALVGGAIGLAARPTPAGVGTAAYGTGVAVTPTAGWGAPPSDAAPGVAPTGAPTAETPPPPAPAPEPPAPPAPAPAPPPPPGPGGAPPTPPPTQPEPPATPAGPPASSQGSPSGEGGAGT